MGRGVRVIEGEAFVVGGQRGAVGNAQGGGFGCWGARMVSEPTLRWATFGAARGGVETTAVWDRNPMVLLFGAGAEVRDQARRIDRRGA